MKMRLLTLLFCSVMLTLYSKTAALKHDMLLNPTIHRNSTKIQSMPDSLVAKYFKNFLYYKIYRNSTLGQNKTHKKTNLELLYGQLKQILKARIDSMHPEGRVLRRQRKRRYFKYPNITVIRRGSNLSKKIKEIDHVKLKKLHSLEKSKKYISYSDALKKISFKLLNITGMDFRTPDDDETLLKSVEDEEKKDDGLLDKIREKGNENQENHFKEHKDLTSENCRDKNCHWCNNDNQCGECEYGNFLFEGGCVKVCPENYVADIFRKICAPSEGSSSVVYTKAFTIGSCKNRCGEGNLEDCSCTYDCAKSGRCCSDFSDCQILSDRNKEEAFSIECKKKFPNCEMCDYNDNGSLECSQCSEDYYLSDSSCLTLCKFGDRINEASKLCINPKSCDVEFCNYCNYGDSNTCARCFNGKFLYNGKCVNECPQNYQADRANWECMENDSFSWYWVVPAIGSCFTHCGTDLSKKFQCSCDTSCIRKGNCCFDIEEVCNMDTNTDLFALKRPKKSDNNKKDEIDKIFEQYKYYDENIGKIQYDDFDARRAPILLKKKIKFLKRNTQDVLSKLKQERQEKIKLHK